MNEKSRRTFAELIGLYNLEIKKAEKDKSRVEEIVDADLTHLLLEKGITDEGIMDNLRNKHRTSLIKLKTYSIDSAIAQLENQRDYYQFYLSLN
jgi:hypothetical protein